MKRILCLAIVAVFIGATAVAQDLPSESRKGKEHRTTGKSSGPRTEFGDGSVHFRKGKGGLQPDAKSTGHATVSSGKAPGTGDKFVIKGNNGQSRKRTRSGNATGKRQH